MVICRGTQYLVTAGAHSHPKLANFADLCDAAPKRCAGGSDQLGLWLCRPRPDPGLDHSASVLSLGGSGTSLGNPDCTPSCREINRKQ